MPEYKIYNGAHIVSKEPNEVFHANNLKDCIEKVNDSRGMQMIVVSERRFLRINAVKVGGNWCAVRDGLYLNGNPGPRDWQKAMMNLNGRI